MKIRDRLLDAIKEKMTRQNMTQVKLSELTGIPKATINDYINNKGNDFKFMTLWKIMQALEIDFKQESIKK